jgi:uncharacterized membrane protein
MVVRQLAREPQHPALADHARERAYSLQNRIAQRIASAVGTMWWIYLHAAGIVLWIVLQVEGAPSACSRR